VTYQAALQELTLFKSRTSTALLQAQERCERVTAEADSMQSQYEQAWGGAESAHSRGRRLLDELTKVRTASRVPPVVGFVGVLRDFRVCWTLLRSLGKCFGLLCHF
jgi:hypothetical protein